MIAGARYRGPCGGGTDELGSGGASGVGEPSKIARSFVRSSVSEAWKGPFYWTRLAISSHQSRPWRLQHCDARVQSAPRRINIVRIRLGDDRPGTTVRPLDVNGG